VRNKGQQTHRLITKDWLHVPLFLLCQQTILERDPDGSVVTSFGHTPPSFLSSSSQPKEILTAKIRALPPAPLFVAAWVAQMSMLRLILFSLSFSLSSTCHSFLLATGRAQPPTPLMAPNRLRAIPMVDRRTNWPARGHMTSSRSRVTWSGRQHTLFYASVFYVCVCPFILSVNSLFLYHCNSLSCLEMLPHDYGCMVDRLK
jgi:hypothetical protein